MSNSTHNTNAIKNGTRKHAHVWVGFACVCCLALVGTQSYAVTSAVTTVVKDPGFSRSNVHFLHLPLTLETDNDEEIKKRNRAIYGPGGASGWPDRPEARKILDYRMYLYDTQKNYGIHDPSLPPIPSYIAAPGKQQYFHSPQRQQQQVHYQQQPFNYYGHPPQSGYYRQPNSYAINPLYRYNPLPYTAHHYISFVPYQLQLYR